MSVNSRNNSRFSTLKVFKFNKERPPPPPPKDGPRYGLQVQGGPYSSSKSLYNPSVTSLIPPTTDVVPSLPSTPVTTDCSRASPVSSQSAPSVRSFAPSTSVESDGGLKPKRNIFKFSSMGKRLNRSTRNLVELDPAEPQEDEGISTPWNFQHNIHVDEGFVGLPPSWSAALSQAGFTDDEIISIHARRTAAHGTPTSQHSNSRPDSPISLLHYPAPRTSSLANAALAARSSNSTLQANTSPTASSFNFPPSRQASYTGTTSSHTTSVAEADTVDTQYVFVNGSGHESMIDPYPLDTQSVSTHHSGSTNHTTPPQIARAHSDTGHVPARVNPHVPSPLVHSHSLPPHLPLGLLTPHGTPRTPPRRVLHVANASDESPPPAYHSPVRSSGFLPEKAGISSGSGTKTALDECGHVRDNGDGDSILDISAAADTTSSSLYADLSLPLPITDVDPALLNRHLSPTPPLVIDKRPMKANALPPRLSFHLSADLGLGDWGAGLLGGIEEDESESGSRIASARKNASASSLRNTHITDRGEGSSSLLPGFSLSSSRPSRSPSTSSRTPSTPTSSKSHSPTTSASTPSTSPSPSAPSPPPSEPLDPSMLSPTLPDVSFGANITLGAPLRVMVPRNALPTPTRNVFRTPKRDLPPTPHETNAEDNRKKDDHNPVLLDVSLGPNVSSLGAAFGMGSSNTAEELMRSSSPPAEPRSASSFERLPSASSVGKSPTSSVTVSSQSPISSTSAASSTGGEGLASSGDRSSSSSLLPARPAGDRDSGMSTVTVTPATIVSVSGAMAITLATASVVESDSVSMSSSAAKPHGDDAGSETEDGASIIPLDSDPSWPEPPLSPDLDTTPRQATRFRTTSLIRVQGSPHSSNFSSEGSTTESTPLVTPKLQLPPSPLRDKSFAPEAALLTSMTDTFGGRESDSEEGFMLTIPKVQSHLQRLPAWVADTVAPLSEFIVDVDPQEYFADLQEIAEGESGSVYASRVVCPQSTLSIPPETTHVAIKTIPVQPSISPKLQDLRQEMELMRGVHHEHVLRMDAFYVNVVDDSLWIRMELMERSLADVVGLVCEGLSLQERMIARFASDVLLALEYLQKHQIAHRDVRSDNLLLNASGIVKIADFSNAVRVTRNSPMCFGAVGVIYWQAPEMRVGAYNALKVDIWSLGATVWELAQTEPPFADVQDPRQIGAQWPALRQPELYSRAFHDFLRLCSRPSVSRPNANELLNTPFIRNACGRAVNVQLLSQCRAIEEHVLQRENTGES
ncbi:uncharacterized protein EDB91DRAFT_1151105 [Suillus paluster]|uniref:uncharacterized protein n=1 Tax=Suillus paluster TaxID=48578 RepID=UPI001B87F30D|nr:uncharacterized protein EDB91DRAFT_1151105 [Suillus paluster]KAG1732620.1 hypothetical protein EDB91DRAFT_1151105 [Suillus paluster]